MENLWAFGCEHAFALPICSVDACSKDSRVAYGLRFLLVRLCILVCMAHETNVMNPELAMTVGWMTSCGLV